MILKILIKVRPLGRMWNEVDMAIGLIGRKCGMTRVFTEDGSSVPVTVVEASPNRVTQVKTVETDGYRAVQVTLGSRKTSRLTKALAGHYKKSGVEPGRGSWEFKLADGEGKELATGSELKVDQFEAGQMVDVAGISIGKGFAGTIKRHHFRGGRASHGNSLSHRAPGSIGQRQTPGRVFPGLKMSGHLGNKRVTIQNLQVVRVDAEKNLILIRGGVPGAPGADLIISPAVKG
jgi:large subunit ribosomal protein L3